jgi:hypothetical protein
VAFTHTFLQLIFKLFRISPIRSAIRPEYNVPEKQTLDNRVTDRVWSAVSHLGGVVVSVLATGPKGGGFEPRRWIFKGDKNPQHTFFG